MADTLETTAVENIGPLHRPTSARCGICTEDLETWLAFRGHMAFEHGRIKLEEHFVDEEVVGVSRGWYSIVDDLPTI